MSEEAQYKRMLQDANHEARVTVAALGATIVVWIVLGFGLAGSSVELFHTPLWVIAGTVGTWVFAIIVAIVLARRVFADADFEVASRLAQQDAAATAELPADGAAAPAGAEGEARHE